MKYVLILCLTSLASFAIADKAAIHKMCVDYLLKRLDKVTIAHGVPYKLMTLNKCKGSVLSGLVVNVNANLVVPNGAINNCDIKIWDQSLFGVNTTQVTFKCSFDEIIKVGKIYLGSDFH